MGEMKSLSSGISGFLAAHKEAQERFALQSRVKAVHALWEAAVAQVYRPLGPQAIRMVLEHINAVYIMKAGQVKHARVPALLADEDLVLVVYCDESLFRTDLDARQEFLKMALRKQGENVEAFVIIPTPPRMLNRHPFGRKEEETSLLPGSTNAQASASQTQRESVGILAGKREIRPLDAADEELVARCTAKIEDARLRKAVENAMKASLRSVSRGGVH